MLLLIVAMLGISFAGSAWAQVPARHMPFLPGQDVDRSQGVNGSFSHQPYTNISQSVDFALNVRGMPIVASFDGYVNLIIDRHVDNNSIGSGHGNEVIYCTTFQPSSPDECDRASHLREIFVVPGEFVKQGQVLGLEGSTGYSTAPHLHSHMQAYPERFTSSSPSIPSHYIYTLEYGLMGPWIQHTGTFYGSCYFSSGTCSISMNDALFVEKWSSLPSGAWTTVEVPRPGDSTPSWSGYGWYSPFTVCTLSNYGNLTCGNESTFRKNAYVRRMSGGSWGDMITVYDALSGATEPYIIRAGFLATWDSLGGAASWIGMPIEEERAISTGSEQYFQWGALQWNSSTGQFESWTYPSGVGPGVFQPDRVRDVPYWNRAASYKIVDAWNRNGGAVDIGWPVMDNGAGPGVHKWEPTHFYVQNFDGGTHGPVAIFYDPNSERYHEYDMFDDGTGVPDDGWNRAYVVRTAFWAWYRYNGGMELLKAPINDEFYIEVGAVDEVTGLIYTVPAARQDFLCGFLVWRSDTGEVEEFHKPNRPGCNDNNLFVAANFDPDYIVTATPSSEKTLQTASLKDTTPELTIHCSASYDKTVVEITGPIQDGLNWPMAGSGLMLEYGSNSDGWSGYTFGKPNTDYTGDAYASGQPITYQLELGTYVEEFNFFLYDPSTGGQEFFNLPAWNVTGDCYMNADGNSLDQIGTSYPTPPGEITCELSSEELLVTIEGPVQALLAGWSVYEPTEIQYGSNTDGWTVPYTSGKPSATWTDSWTHTISMDPDVYDFNFYLTNGVGGEWFDLVDADWDGDAWTVGGDCYLNGSAITHDPPPASTATGTITCDLQYDQLIIDIDGPVEQLLVGPGPTNPTSIEYGSETDGWRAPYTLGKAESLWNGTDHHQIVIDPHIYDINFFLTDYTGLEWFDINDADGDGDKWDIVGDCWQNGGAFTHAAPPLPPSGYLGTIDCVEQGPDLVVTVSGSVIGGIFGNPPHDWPVYLEYGSDWDGWDPYLSGKPKKSWYSNFNTYLFYMGTNVNNFNFFLWGVNTGEVSWFDLSQWEITGDCWLNPNGGAVLHY